LLQGAAWSRRFLAALAVPVAFGLAVLEVAVLLLGALWLLVADEVREPSANVPAAGAEKAGAPTDAVLAPLEAGAASSAVTVETAAGMTETDSGTGVSTTADWGAIAVGVGAASFVSREAEMDWTDEVPIDETPETSACGAIVCLGLTVYRTAATPTPVPKSMVSICSKTIFLVTPDDLSLDDVKCEQVKALTQGNQFGMPHKSNRTAILLPRRTKILISNNAQILGVTLDAISPGQALLPDLQDGPPCEVRRSS
jgi:hypothetical protein